MVQNYITPGRAERCCSCDDTFINLYIELVVGSAHTCRPRRPYSSPRHCTTSETVPSFYFVSRPLSSACLYSHPAGRPQSARVRVNKHYLYSISQVSIHLPALHASRRRPGVSSRRRRRWWRKGLAPVAAHCPPEPRRRVYLHVQLPRYVLIRQRLRLLCHLHRAG